MTQTTRDDYSIDGLARLIHHIHQTYRYYDPQGRRLHITVPIPTHLTDPEREALLDRVIEECEKTGTEPFDISTSPGQVTLDYAASWTTLPDEDKEQTP
jgi:hypothetical protein